MGSPETMESNGDDDGPRLQLPEFTVEPPAAEISDIWDAEDPVEAAIAKERAAIAARIEALKETEHWLGDGTGLPGGGGDVSDDESEIEYATALERDDARPPAAAAAPRPSGGRRPPPGFEMAEKVEARRHKGAPWGRGTIMGMTADPVVFTIFFEDGTAARGVIPDDVRPLEGRVAAAPLPREARWVKENAQRRPFEVGDAVEGRWKRGPLWRVSERFFSGTAAVATARARARAGTAARSSR